MQASKSFTRGVVAWPCGCFYYLVRVLKELVVNVHTVYISDALFNKAPGAVADISFQNLCRGECLLSSF